MIREFRSEDYSWAFDNKTGMFARWGKTMDTKDDPKFSPEGPEILDLEISTICHGLNGIPCSHCYKSNSPNGEYMKLSTFQKIVQMFPTNLTQIAFGIGDIDSNPDLEKILMHSREMGIVPNITINGARMNEYYYKILATYCGGVSVSLYNPKDVCYDTAWMLSLFEVPQVNIHVLVSNETIEICKEVLKDYSEDKRLKRLNSIVFLSLKPKGARNRYTPLTDRSKFIDIIKEALDKKIPIGFDSCSSHYFLEAIRGNDHEQNLRRMCEPCESFGLFSSYVNVKGKYFPCSFVEGSHPDFTDGLDVINCKNFMSDIWFSPLVEKWRKAVIIDREKDDFRCPIFNV